MQTVSPLNQVFKLWEELSPVVNEPQSRSVIVCCLHNAGNSLIDFTEFLSLLAIRAEHRHTGYDVRSAFRVSHLFVVNYSPFLVVEGQQRAVALI
jgi:hypothetical protein